MVITAVRAAARGVLRGNHFTQGERGYRRAILERSACGQAVPSGAASYRSARGQ